MFVHIHVTAEDIARGERKSCVACPIALAINRALKPGYFVSFERKTVRIEMNRIYQGQAESITQQLGVYPDGVVDQINRYDQTGEMKPFVFRMSISDRLIGGL